MKIKIEISFSIQDTRYEELFNNDEKAFQLNVDERAAVKSRDFIE